MNPSWDVGISNTFVLLLVDVHYHIYLVKALRAIALLSFDELCLWRKLIRLLGIRFQFKFVSNYLVQLLLRRKLKLINYLFVLHIFMLFVHHDVPITIPEHLPHYWLACFYSFGFFLGFDTGLLCFFLPNFLSLFSYPTVVIVSWVRWRIFCTMVWQ